MGILGSRHELDRTTLHSVLVAALVHRVMRITERAGSLRNNVLVSGKFIRRLTSRQEIPVRAWDLEM